MIRTVVDRTCARFLAMAIAWLSLLLFVFALNSGTSSAAPNTELNFQARLLSNTGSLIADGDYHAEFNLYDDELAGTLLWTETYTTGNLIRVQNGYLTTQLGSLNAFPSTIDWSEELWLTINIGGTGGAPAWDGEMTPRMQVSAVPYAFRAGELQGTTGAVTADDLLQLAPTGVQTISEALAAMRVNQTGAGGLLQLQGDSSDVFTIDKTGFTTVAGSVDINGASLDIGSATQSGGLILNDGGGNTLTLQTGSQTGDLTFTLPVNSGTAGQCLKTDGTGVLSFEDCGSGGGSAASTLGFYAYDAVGDIDVSAGWTDITLDTQVRAEADFTHTAGNAPITIETDGWYEVTYNVSFYTSSGGNTRGTADSKLVEDTGAGFVDIPGSFGSAYLRGAGGEGNVSVVILRQFTAGDIIKLQGQRTTGTLTALTLPNSTGIAIRNISDGSSGGGDLQTTYDASASGLVNLSSSVGGLVLRDASTPLGSQLFSVQDNGGSNIYFSVDSSGLSTSGDIAGTGALTLSSGGSSDLTLDSASDILKIEDSTIQRNAAGVTTIDLLDSSGSTTLAITNSDGTELAGLSVEGATTALSFSGDGSGLTGISGSNITSGTVADARLSSNVALLDTSQAYTATQTFNSGLVLGNTAATTTGSLRWTGADFEGYDGSNWVSLTSSGADVTNIIKTADETVNNSNTLQDDDDLSFNVDANQTWTFDFVVQGNSGTVPDFRYAVTAPLGATCYVGVENTENAQSNAQYGCGVTSQRIAGTGNNEVYRISGTVITAANAGQVTLQWAQFTTDPSDSTILSGSYVRAVEENGASGGGGGGGGGGTSFNQGGNSFGSTALLGTTDNNGLSIVTNGSSAIDITSGGLSTFTQDTTFNSKLLLGSLPTTDSLTQAAFYTGADINKGLVIQGAISQTANLFELQDNTGSVLAGFNSNGSLIIDDVLLNSLATASRTISLPDSDGTLCVEGGDCGFVNFDQAAAQVDSGTNSSVFINKTGASGNILELQKDGNGVFTILNSGALSLNLDSTSALSVSNAAGTQYFNVDTSGAIVRVGAASDDATATLLVLDTKNTTGDPVGVDGAQYYNSSLGKFRCFENGAWTDCLNRTPQIRSFLDTATTATVDNNTTPYWVTGANPSIIPSTTGNGVFGSVTVEFTSTTGQNRDIVARIERSIGSAPTCGSGTVVGGNLGYFSTSTGLSKSSTVTFYDDTATTNEVFYTVCSDSGSNAVGGITVTRVRVTLQEAENSN